MKAGDTIACKEIKKTFVIDEIIMGVAHFEWGGLQHQCGVKELIMFGYEVIKKKREISPINALFKRHHEAIVKRGLIDENTSLDDFFDKIDEEVAELKCAMNDNNLKQESADCVFVIINMLIAGFKDIDIEKELIKNIEHNETRED